MKLPILGLGALACAQAVSLWPLPSSYSFTQDGPTAGVAKNLLFDVPSGSQALTTAAANYQKLIGNALNGCESISSEDVQTCSVLIESMSTPLQLYADESYTLRVLPGSCEIQAQTVWGAIHAMETLTQLVEVNNGCGQIQQTPVSISDSPRFSHRGVLLDTSRHYIPISDILQVIDGLAMNKLNVLHWHIVDSQSFPYDAPSAERLVDGAYAPHLIYTNDDIKQIIDYAAARAVRVMPEIDMPGHAYSWGIGYPDVVAHCPSYEHNVNNIPLNPANPKTYDIVNGVISDIFDVSQETFMHIGGDEVVYGCWKEDPTISSWYASSGYTSWTQVFCEYNNKIGDSIRSQGHTPVYWEEVFLGNCGTPLNDTIYQVWIDQATIKQIAGAGFHTIASPQSYWYLDHLDISWKTMYTYDPTSTLTETEASLIIGGEACSWSETVDEGNVHTRIWPRASAVAERLWSPKYVTDTTSATTRLTEHRCRMKARGIATTPLGPGNCPVDYV